MSRAEAVHRYAVSDLQAVLRGFEQRGHYLAQDYARPLRVGKANPGLFRRSPVLVPLRSPKQPVMPIEHRKAAVARAQAQYQSTELKKWLH